LKKRRKLLVGAAALSVSIAIIPLAATGLFQSVSSSILATRHNPLGIEARVAYVHENTAMSCPMRPCDTSGFVLNVMSKENAVFLGYDVCKVGALSCAHYEGFASSLVATPEHSNQPERWGSQSLGWKSDWHADDKVDIKVNVTPASSEPMSGWVELGESQILEFEIT
jgi:hypothetical protein